MNKTTVLALALATSGCSLYFDDDERSSTVDVEPDPDPHAGPLPASCGDSEVHVFGVYETRSDHSATYRPTGSSTIRVERPGHHTLVLASYEPTVWHLDLAPGAIVDRVHLIGYHTQTLADAGLPVTFDTYEQGGEAACGYSWPYNGEGCDTNQLIALARARAGAEITSFHGCYRATEWTLTASGEASSDCATDAGYETNAFYGACEPEVSEWIPAAFGTLGPTACTGSKHVKYNAEYGVWVGAIQCGSAERYKLYMSPDRDQPFLEIADYAGHGQDHCELVNAEFSIPNEDEITSGGCTACSVDDVVDIDGVPVYARATFGEPFERVTSRFWADLTTTSYACGVSIP